MALKTLSALGAAVVVVFVSAPPRAAELAVEQIAEGRTSTSPAVGIVAKYRMFTVPMLNEMCPSIPRPSRLVVPHQPIRMVRGQWFPYNRLVVLAYDGQDHLLPGIPIQIGVEHVEPPVLDLHANMIAGAKVFPLRAGAFRIEVAPACGPDQRPEEVVTAVAKAEVVEP